MDLIAFYADNALIKKATSAEETPTPGYLYHEIVGITHKSVEACQNLENVLMSRLENESPIVKLKTLRTIKHILQKGHVTVKRDLMGRVASIRPCLHARGPPDALRGDALWQSVRSEAQDVMNIIFDTEQRAAAAPVAVSSMGSDQMGSRSYSNGNTSNSNNYSSSNSNYEAANANYISSSSTRSYGSGAGGSGTGTSSFGSNQSNSPFSQDIKNKISSLPSKIMGNTRPSHELSNFGSLNAAVTHASPHAHTSAGAANDFAYAPPTAPSQSLDEESGLVDDITNAGGSSSLSFQALEQFCTRSALLDQYKIAELLIRKLEARTWQVRHKALYAIESLLLSSTGSVIRDICIERHAVFESLLGGMQAATREKAKQVLTLLGISIESLPAPTSSSSSPYSPPPASSHVSSPSPSHFEQEAEPANPPSSLFAGLSIASPTTHPEPEQAYNPPMPQQQLISIDNTDGEEEKAATIARNTSLLSFLEASANVPPSPSILRDLGSTAPPNENDDSPLISSSPGPSQPSLAMTPLSFGSPLPETASSPLIDLGNDVSDSPDILSKFRNNHPLKSSSPLPTTSNGINSSLSSSQPISPPTSSFLAELMETPPPSSLEELLATPGTFLAPSAAPPTSNNSISILSYPSSPFGAPAKVAMVPNAQLKHAPSTIPQSALQQYQQQQLPLNFNLPPQPAPGSIKTTSATSVFNPVYSVPRAVSSPTTGAPSSSSYSSSSYSSSSSSSSFNFVQQQKKGDAFGDLVSIQIKQMGK